MPATQMQMVLALDAMGGDLAPDSVLKGANLALRRYPELQFLFFGDEDVLNKKLSRLKKVQKVSQVIHCPKVIPATMSASQALRNSRDTSMYMAIKAAADGRANAVISAGNTGALMALSKMILKTINGVRRPAITAFFPSVSGSVIMLDLGATIECDALALYQFGLMGSTFAQTVLGWNEPSVGLLNVGEEYQKGHEELKEAASMLRLDPRVTFKGFIESNHISHGRVDVVVTDGFTGNIALKMAEGTADLINKMTKRAFKYTTIARLGYMLARPAFMKLKERLDPRRYNGAVFLGLQKTVIKSHGRSDALATATAIGVAVDMIKYDTIAIMAQRFSQPDVVNNTADMATVAV